VKPQIDAPALPHGYSIEWGGDAENSSEAQQGLFTTLPLGYLVMFVHHRADVQLAEKRDRHLADRAAGADWRNAGLFDYRHPLALWR
jgi:hypothetical protein